jgi:endoglucanase
MMTKYSALKSIALLILTAGCLDPAGVEQVDRSSAALTTQGLFYQGINLTGAERGFGSSIEETWGPAIPGVEGQTHVWPNPDSNSNVSALDTALFPGGMNSVRLPFQWERLQPALNGPLDAAYLAKLKATTDVLRRRGATVVLDVHNYAFYKVRNRGTAEPGQSIGSPDVPVGALADLWRRLAQEFGSTSKSHPVVFGLMNEPHALAVSVWVEAARQSVAAIRAAGAKNLLLVPGADWTTAADFAWSQNRSLLQSVTDPDDNMAIEVHQYYNGTCVANGYVDKLKPFEDWAVANNRLAWLGELDLHDGDACHQAFRNLLTHLHAKAAGTTGGVWIGYTYWAIDASNNTSGANFVATPFPYLRMHLPSTCGNGARDGQETEIDCGGTCRRCGDGKACAKDTDCQSGFCTGNVCSTAGGAGGISGAAGTGGTGGRGGSTGASGSGGTTGGTSGAAGTGGTGGRGGSTGAGGSGGSTGGASGLGGASGTGGGHGGTSGGGGATSAGGRGGATNLGGSGGAPTGTGGAVAGTDGNAAGSGGGQSGANGCACQTATGSQSAAQLLLACLGAVRALRRRRRF